MSKSKVRENIYLNKKAFDEIIGSPDEPGSYVTARVRNSTQAMLYGADGEPSAPNLAAPSKADFCCDVESAFEAAINGRNLLQKFIQHYIIGKDSLSRDQQSRLEQQVGAQFRRRGIYPVGRYFTAIRKKRGK